jgi:hypothetical protein
MSRQAQPASSAGVVGRSRHRVGMRTASLTTAGARLGILGQSGHTASQPCPRDRLGGPAGRPLRRARSGWGRRWPARVPALRIDRGSSPVSGDEPRPKPPRWPGQRGSSGTSSTCPPLFDRPAPYGRVGRQPTRPAGRGMQPSGWSSQCVLDGIAQRLDRRGTIGPPVRAPVEPAGQARSLAACGEWVDAIDKDGR